MKLNKCLRTDGKLFKCEYSGITYFWKQENKLYPQSPIRLNHKTYGDMIVTDKYLLKILWRLDNWENI